MNRKLISLILGLFLMPTFALADTLVLEPNRDNTLYEDAGGRFSNGAGSFLFIGRTGADNGIINLARRALVRFELSAIPPGSTIEDVSLSLTIDQVPMGATPGTATLQRVIGNWGEGASNAPGPEGQGTAAQPGDATWAHAFFNTQFWTNPGGDFAAINSASTGFSSFAETITFVSTAGLISDVQLWTDSPSNNFGWILRGDEVSGMNARRLQSRENLNAAGRPSLTIQFTPAPAGPQTAVGVPTLSTAGRIALAMALLAMAVLLRRRAAR